MWLDSCALLEKMPYFNESTNVYDCYPIYDFGPCKPKQWFVLNKDDPEHAKCVENECACGPVDEYYDYENEEECINNIQEQGHIYVDFKGKCFEAKDTIPCPFGQWVVPNEYGEGKLEIKYCKSLKETFLS